MILSVKSLRESYAQYRTDKRTELRVFNRTLASNARTVGEFTSEVDELEAGIQNRLTEYDAQVNRNNSRIKASTVSSEKNLFLKKIAKIKKGIL